MSIRTNAPIALGAIALVATLFLIYNYINTSVAFFGTGSSCVPQVQLSTTTGKELWESSNAVTTGQGKSQLRYKGALACPERHRIS